jgi:hypothetical protein
VTGALRGDHQHVHVGRRLDQPVPDVEAVAEEECLARGERRGDRLGIDLALRGVGGEHHDHVCLGGGLGRRHHPQPLLLGLGTALRALGQADADVDAGVAQRQRVRVTLAAVSDHRYLAALDHRQVGVVVVVHLGGHVLPFSSRPGGLVPW